MVYFQNISEFFAMEIINIKNGNHKHNNVESEYNALQGIIKVKPNMLYKYLSRYHWNNCL